MAQDFLKKRQNIATDARDQAAEILKAERSLDLDAGILAQAGGNFEDADFSETNLTYLNAYQINTFLQQVVPAFTTFLDAHLGGDAGQPTHRQYLEIMVSGPVK